MVEEEADAADYTVVGLIFVNHQLQLQYEENNFVLTILEGCFFVRMADAPYCGEMEEQPVWSLFNNYSRA